VAAAGIGEASRHLGELVVREKGTALVVEVAALQLPDEVAALVRPLLERLDHDAVDPADPLGKWARGHRVQHPVHLGEQCHPCHGYWNQPSKSMIALTLPAPLYISASPLESSATNDRFARTAPASRLRSETPGGPGRLAGYKVRYVLVVGTIPVRLATIATTVPPLGTPSSPATTRSLWFAVPAPIADGGLHDADS